MIDLEFVAEIGSGDLKLPNAVCILKGGRLAVADGGKDAVLIYDQNGCLNRLFQGTGLGQYKLKEPVAISSDGCGRIFVADWHNHRVVIYNEQLTYLDEFGHRKIFYPGPITSNFRRFISVIKTFLWSGTYTERHFTGSNATENRHLLSATEISKSLLHFIRAQVRLLSYMPEAIRWHAFDKPNGFAFIDSKVFITQKNAKCVTIHDASHPFRLIDRMTEPHPRLAFGRLGNVACGSKGELFVCDEQKETIWFYDYLGQKPKRLTGLDSGTGRFMPFSCTQLNERLIAVCGGLKIQIMDIYSNEVVWASEPLGELHGVAWDDLEKRLYLVNRSKAIIQVFSLRWSHE